MEFENKEKNIDLYVLDLRNGRFLKINYKERIESTRLSLSKNLD